ncbi:hypothetical protein [Pelagibacterium luteolum]|uniref:hypothetical protein n=1 Tax=Pelagibacterium luteolum TaxID=440168 RepID=UPI000B88AF86|nr:hypothetical protein [Pelagibacterium luteolum]
MLSATSIANAQEEAAAPAQPQIDVEQVLVDLDALIHATRATTRCALYDEQIDYLTPLEQVGASVRLNELTSILEGRLDDLADRVAMMGNEATALPCGDDALVPYMTFGQQIGRDVIDIAMRAWREIEIANCSYFADDDFMAAVDRAQEAADTAIIEGAENRQDYIEQQADVWVGIFSSSCANLYFDPVTTLPGQIALALPTP